MRVPPVTVLKDVLVREVEGRCEGVGISGAVRETYTGVVVPTDSDKECESCVALCVNAVAVSE